MPLSPEYKKKCHCTRVQYPYDPRSKWDYICGEHRSDWDTRFINIFYVGMRDVVDFKLEYKIGFEDFGAYETWGQGWIAQGTLPKDGKIITTSHRYMKNAVDLWLLAAEKHLAK